MSFICSRRQEEVGRCFLRRGFTAIVFLICLGIKLSTGQKDLEDVRDETLFTTMKHTHKGVQRFGRGFLQTRRCCVFAHEVLIRLFSSWTISFQSQDKVLFMYDGMVAPQNLLSDAHSSEM